MRTLLRLFLLQIMLFGWLFAGGQPLAAAAAAQQPSARVDAYAIATEDGYLYLAGSAVGLAGQLGAGSLDLAGGMTDLWVAKVRPDGSPVFQAVIGGKGDDAATGLAVRQGVVYITGETWSDNFPQAPGSAGENDALALALSADGGSILWARRIGGSDQDSGRAIALWQDSLYLTGISWSQDLVAGGGLGDADGFLARLELDGSLRWLKPFGGRGLDAPFSLSPGPGGIWVAGETFSANLAGTLPGGGDAFALRFDAGGAEQFAGVYGGSGEDVAYASALAPDGSLYLAGETQSRDLPGVTGQPGGDTDGFVMRIDQDGALQAAAYLGSPGLDTGMGLAVLPGGNALVTGSTGLGAFLAGSALAKAGKGGRDAYLVEVNPRGEPVWLGLQGGPGDDEARALVLAPDGIALVGQFSGSAPGYLLVVPAAEGPDTRLPTGVPTAATATQASTATPQPTETPRPTATETLTPTETIPAADTPVIPTADHQASATPVAISAATVTRRPAETAASAGETPAAPPAFTATVEATLPATPGDSSPPAGWIGAGLAAGALALGAGFFLYRRRKARP